MNTGKQFSVFAGLMGHEFSRAVVVVLWLVLCGALTVFLRLIAFGYERIRGFDNLSRLVLWIGAESALCG